MKYAPQFFRHTFPLLAENSLFPQLQISRDASPVHWQAVLLHLEYPSQTVLFFLSSMFPNTNCAFLAISAFCTSRPLNNCKKWGDLWPANFRVFYMEKVLTVPSVESKGSQHVMSERKQEALLSDDILLSGGCLALPWTLSYHKSKPL